MTFGTGLGEIGPQSPGLGDIGGASVEWVDLGLVDLATVVSGGPQTLYNMPAGSYLSSIRFTDDPDTVPMDTDWPPSLLNNISVLGIGFGTIKSFGWSTFAQVYWNNSAVYFTADGTLLVDAGFSYGPFAALDTGIWSGVQGDTFSLVLSAASVGPIQAAFMLIDTSNLVHDALSGGNGVRVGAITAWAANTVYGSPASNTLSTPGALQTCAIVANGTIWINDGATGTSGGTSPNFAGSAGGHIADGASIVWWDTTKALPTVGAVHPVAEIIVPILA